MRLLSFFYPVIEQDQEYKEKFEDLLTANSKQVLDLLSMYIQATGAEASFPSKIFLHNSQVSRLLSSLRYLTVCVAGLLLARLAPKTSPKRLSSLLPSRH